MSREIDLGIPVECRSGEVWSWVLEMDPLPRDASHFSSEWH